MRSQFHILTHVGKRKAKVDAEFGIPTRHHGIAHNLAFSSVRVRASMDELIKSRHENKTLIIMGALMSAWASLCLCLCMRRNTAANISALSRLSKVKSYQRARKKMANSEYTLDRA